MRSRKGLVRTSALGLVLAVLAPAAAFARYDGIARNGNGTPMAVDANTQVMGVSDDVVHLDAWNPSPGGSAGDWSYDLSYMAVSVAGTYTISFSGMAYDSSLDASTGDVWNTESFQIAVEVPEPATALLVSLGLGMLVFAGNRQRR